MNLNLTNLKDLDYICQIATDYFESRRGTMEEITWLQRISRYRQLIQFEIHRLEAEPADQLSAECRAELERRAQEEGLTAGQLLAKLIKEELDRKID